MVAALDREVSLERAHLLEGHVATLRGIQFRLEMRVRHKDEVEVLRRSGWR